MILQKITENGVDILISVTELDKRKVNEFTRIWFQSSHP